ncbi:MAG: ubiquinol-cytochrome c reductase iron-sulfur subunit [Acidobacteriota bacterium]
MRLETERVEHEKVGTILVGCAFLVSAAGGISFLVAYWTGGSNWLLGSSLAVFLGGSGIMLVLWSHLLTLRHQVVMKREQLNPPPQAREAAAEDFDIGEQQIHRRGLLKWMAAGAGALFASIFVTWFRSLGSSPDPVLFSTVWKPGQRLMTQDGNPVSVNDLQPGNTVIVFPEGSIGSERAQTVLLRVHQDLLHLPSDRHGWAPMGNLAFSRVCTHAGCAVGMYETTTHLLMCPCHQSTFDVLRGAQPTGGPAARPLPQLPLYADEQGILRAAGGFSAPPGPGFWGMPS